MTPPARHWSFAIVSLLIATTASADKPFVITVVDAQTRRGVPLVELTSTGHVKFITDSAGLVTITDPDLLGQKAFFHVVSHGYEFPKDGFGFAGRAIEVKPGGETTLELKRLNIAERLYRSTGGGIYHHSIAAGRPAPIAKPLLNAEVLGQDSIQRIVYNGKLYWFWGDTNRMQYPLGHFGMSGATSDLPGKGGLDPAVGVNYTYFTDPKTGFARPMVPGQNLRWSDAHFTLKDASGKERMYAKLDILKSLTETVGRKLIVYNDQTDQFDDVLTYAAKDEPLCPGGHPIRHTVAGVEYLYFPQPYALLRVKADLDSIKTPAAYEGYTPLAPGTRYAKADTKIERDNSGNPVWAWKPNTPPVNVDQQNDLIKRALLKPEQGFNRPIDVDTNQTLHTHNGSVNWNPFRNKWVMIHGVFGGKDAPSTLGEIYYSESDSDQPHGPFTRAKKILTHDRYSFYNPNHHPVFDQQGGRIIYFEGTYTYTFSRSEKEGPTPRYDYNNIMYRLDLSDPRLKLN
ncbi:MAG TPA: hypothetical protein VEA69_09230 [Tepidisphaeraceae bacterium]|nr:hypothetical protein [Tepidisphaeraceae bacterium]